jgi:type IV pilus biogenesis protein CpaD/CtpE
MDQLPIRITFVVLIATSLFGCASGKCRQKKTNKDFVQQARNLPEFQKKQPKKVTYEDLKIIQVHVPDGSLQCEANSQKPVNSFKQKLENNGIKVIKVSHVSDGAIRIQVCGSPTGMLYVFEIQQVDLEKAKKLGFQVHNSSM